MNFAKQNVNQMLSVNKELKYSIIEEYPGGVSHTSSIVEPYQNIQNLLSSQKGIQRRIHGNSD